MRIRLHKDGRKHFTEDEWTQIIDSLQYYVDEFKLDSHDTLVYVRFPAKLNISHRLGLVDRGVCIAKFKTSFELTPSNTIKSIRAVDKFIIDIVPSSFTKVIETIFHEMTHVVQELRGDFVRNDDGSEIYKGVHYSVDKLTKPTYKEYRQFPWEIEAREVATEMLQKWQKSRNIKQTFWQKFVTFWS